MADLENNIVALVIAIRNFLKGLNETHLNSFLADWPSSICMTRSVFPHSLPVLSWMPAAVRAAGKNTEFIAKMLASLANHIAWGQTYSAEDFGAGFLDKYGWTELIGLPIYHASGLPHAMRTETVPLLALYLWHGGNLVQKSCIA